MTFLAFVICGAIPLVSFIIPGFTTHHFLISSLMTAIALFLVGSFRVFVTPKGWFRGGIEMLCIGGLAAVIAYGVGYFIAKLLY